MAQIFPPGLGTLLHLQQGCINRPPLPKDLNHFLLHQSPYLDLANPHTIDLGLQRQEDYLLTSSRLLECNKLMMMDSSTRSSPLADVQGTQLEILLFGLQVAIQCSRQESILNLLASGSKDRKSMRDLLFDLGSRKPSLHLSLPSSDSNPSHWSFTDAESEWMSLAYPTRELYFNDHSLETCNCMESFFLHPDGRHIRNYSESEGHNLHALLSAFSELQVPKATVNKSSNLTMLVPYFESRRSSRSKKDVTSSIKSAKTKKAKREARIMEKKPASARTSKGSEAYPETYLHACDCLLSLIVHQKQPDKSAIHSLKKSGSQMLIDFTAAIAGAGIAVLLTVFYAVMGRGLPLCYPRILSAGFGLGLVWLSSALNKLRGTLMSICKSSGDAGGGLEKSIRVHLDRNVKDICSRAAALMAIAFLAICVI